MPIWPCAFCTQRLERARSWAVVSPWAELAGAHRTTEGQQAHHFVLWATGGPALELTPLPTFFGGCNIPGGAVVVFAASWWLGTCLLLRCRGTSCIWHGGLGGTWSPRLHLACSGGGTPRGDVAESEKEEGPKPGTSPESSNSSAWIIFMALWMKNKRFVIYPQPETSRRADLQLPGELGRCFGPVSWRASRST